jgi:hypothetical protein
MPVFAGLYMCKGWLYKRELARRVKSKIFLRFIFQALILK